MFIFDIAGVGSGKVSAGFNYKIYFAFYRRNDL
jgi:hypothetical protein